MNPRGAEPAPTGHCMKCKRGPLTGPGLLYEVTGFEEPRSQGGANKIVNRRRTGRIICGGCLHVVQGEQESLL